MTVDSQFCHMDKASFHLNFLLSINLFLFLSVLITFLKQKNKRGKKLLIHYFPLEVFF